MSSALLLRNLDVETVFKTVFAINCCCGAITFILLIVLLYQIVMVETYKRDKTLSLVTFSTPLNKIILALTLSLLGYFVTCAVEFVSALSRTFIAVSECCIVHFLFMRSESILERALKQRATVLRIMWKLSPAFFILLPIPDIATLISSEVAEMDSFRKINHIIPIISGTFGTILLTILTYSYVHYLNDSWSAKTALHVIGRSQNMGS
ncbi:hypothetical protein BCR33DRAFT_109732 [Rhizoclosmatium globosum]|uniref:Uncharacterized protein n=1 Tax=Rhizoclosmatium globosum TaxID=329046 RepID=A0A1Y2CID0_9FUNG|nr:hypothetical protein BCR33DRAFT_109732 [Rhizoclosmatium globosum]|eukprot:ORY46772.1 hypothetical protein BCR33DRAFT_109732 [Rhizoclosmatium globosum]